MIQLLQLKENNLKKHTFLVHFKKHLIYLNAFKYNVLKWVQMCLKYSMWFDVKVFQKVAIWPICSSVQD